MELPVAAAVFLFLKEPAASAALPRPAAGTFESPPVSSPGGWPPLTEPTPILSLWYQALQSEYGIVVFTSDPDRFIQKLYRARAQAGDERLNKISIKRSPTTEDEIWLLKQR